LIPTFFGERVARYDRAQMPPARKPEAEPSRPRLYTIGHSTHPIERFLELLGEHRIATLVDIRSFPSSRRWPHFNQTPLAEALGRASIEYKWLKSLGGRRHDHRPDSPHVAWTVAAFRSYADYADTAEFEVGAAELSDIAAATITAIMCSEGLWWRCHRRIVSDQMAMRGWDVEHILPNGRLAAHKLPDFASIRDGRIVYNGGQRTLLG
jgi:uncharacterized protein (DUF488 family)